MLMTATAKKTEKNTEAMKINILKKKSSIANLKKILKLVDSSNEEQEKQTEIKKLQKELDSL